MAPTTVTSSSPANFSSRKSLRARGGAANGDRGVASPAAALTAAAAAALAAASPAHPSTKVTCVPLVDSCFRPPASSLSSLYASNAHPASASASVYANDSDGDNDSDSDSAATGDSGVP